MSLHKKIVEELAEVEGKYNRFAARREVLITARNNAQVYEADYKRAIEIDNFDYAEDLEKRLASLDEALYPSEVREAPSVEKKKKEKKKKEKKKKEKGSSAFSKSESKEADVAL